MIRDLITADIHLAINNKNEHIWEFFPMITSLIREHNVKRLIILGDLTESKDKHNAELVNRVVMSLASIPCHIIILMGNHDYIDKDTPFFGFLDKLPNVTFIKQATSVYSEGTHDLFLPHTMDPSTFWKDVPFDEADVIFMHQTVTGVVLPNKHIMDKGVAWEFFEDVEKAKIFSGDIHIPQKVGRVEYIGAPYPVYFGDTYTGRVLLREDNKFRYINYNTIKKWSLTVSSLDDLFRHKVRAYDQLKLKYEISAGDKHKWQEIRKSIRKHCITNNIDLCGIELIIQKATQKITKGAAAIKRHSTPDAILTQYAAHEKLSNKQLDFGLKIMEGV